MVYSIHMARDGRKPQTQTQMAFFNDISKPVFNQALGFGTVLQERREHVANWGPFYLETVTVREAATGIANTWTKHVETRQVVRDLETMELQKCGTHQECADFIVANMRKL